MKDFVGEMITMVEEKFRKDNEAGKKKKFNEQMS